MKPEPQKDTAPFNCYDQFLIQQRITERQGPIAETIGHLTMCARRFLSPKPDYVVDFMQTLSHSLPDCATCCRELTSFRKSIKVDFTKTKRTKEQVREWISGQVRRGCRDFFYDPQYTDKSDMLPNPAAPTFGDYNPDQYTEPGQKPEALF